MPNDPPYGGRIEVNRDGSVIWQVAAREYPKDRDTDGTLEYAIRMVDASRNMFTSRDGKCILQVHLCEPVPAKPCSETTNAPAEHVELDGNMKGHVAQTGQSQMIVMCVSYGTPDMTCRQRPKTPLSWASRILSR